ncbi:MAG: hypothetical protein AB7V50_03795 [Vampirovibrionia bacterium]
MFKCTQCDQIDDFSLMLSSDYTGPGNFSQTYNEFNEILINIDGFEFIPDLSFMNSHAVCRFCNAIHSFEYCFNKDADKPDDKSCNIDKNPKSKNKG